MGTETCSLNLCRQCSWVSSAAAEYRKLSLDGVRGDVVVGVSEHGAPDQFAPSLLNFLRHTAPGVPIVIWGGASARRDIHPLVGRALKDAGGLRRSAGRSIATQLMVAIAIETAIAPPMKSAG